MKKILIIAERFLPGYKDGGPVRSVVNLINHLGSEYEFYILTSDRDHGDTEQYPNIETNEWLEIYGVKVMYVEPGGFTSEIILDAAKDKCLVYCCGAFNNYSIRSMILKRMGRLHQPLIVASMGMFSPGALKFHYLKKKTFILVFKMAGMFRKLTWSATSSEEAEDIRKNVGKRAVIDLAMDLPRAIGQYSGIDKESGKLRVAFVSRIDGKKNLLYAIKILNMVEGDIELHIYGPIQDREYYDLCMNELCKASYKWEYHGMYSSERITEAFCENHIFLFPTLGENYGHVIAEALSSGRPVVVSDTTPWKDLGEKGIGAVIPLSDLDQYVHCIQEYVNMGNEEYEACCKKAYEYACEFSNAENRKQQYRDMFEKRGI